MQNPLVEIMAPFFEALSEGERRRREREQRWRNFWWHIKFFGGLFLIIGSIFGAGFGVAWWLFQ